MNTDEVRLNKHLALVLGVSRREADDLIERGKVKIDGTVAILGARFLEGASISVNDQVISETVDFVYLLLNKPLGYICSRKSQDENPTIYELLPRKYHTLKPVGRLDKDSSGIILLTNDGDFAYKMTHPKFAKSKLYKLELERSLEPLHHQMIANYGVDLTDGKSKFGLEKIDEASSKRWYVHMKEGRNRQIRRTFGALGYTVTKLHRSEFGPYRLGELASGEFVETIAL